MTREEIVKSMSLQDAIQVFKDTNCYGTMDIAKSVILKALEQEPVIDKIRAEIAEYGSIWVEYKITGRRDKDIEQLVSDVLSQAKKQVLEVIDKYKAESEDKE